MSKYTKALLLAFLLVTSCSFGQNSAIQEIEFNRGFVGDKSTTDGCLSIAQTGLSIAHGTISGMTSAYAIATDSTVYSYDSSTGSATVLTAGLYLALAEAETGGSSDATSQILFYISGSGAKMLAVGATASSHRFDTGGTKTQGLRLVYLPVGGSIKMMVWHDYGSAINYALSLTLIKIR